MSNAVKKLKEFIAKFSKEEQDEIEKYSKIEVKMKDVKTKDGSKTLSYDGETPAVGMPVMDNTSGTPMACPDGVYTLDDGSVLTVAGGLITAVESAAAETPEQMAARQALEKAVPQIAQMSVQMKEQKTAYEKTINDQRKEINELKKAVQLTSKTLQILLETPIQMASASKGKEKKYEDMTNAEKVRFNRGEKIYE